MKAHGVLCSTDEDSLSLVFDPLCLFAPFTHRAKMLFQLTWREGTDWDDFLPDDQQKKWRELFAELAELCSISVPRCLHPFRVEPEQEVLVFTDASEQAYAAAVYAVPVRNGVRCSNLFLSRAIVSPKARTQTIPRLDFMEALLGLRLVKKVCNTLGKELRGCTSGPIPWMFFAGSGTKSLVFSLSSPTECLKSENLPLPNNGNTLWFQITQQTHRQGA